MTVKSARRASKRASASDHRKAVRKRTSSKANALYRELCASSPDGILLVDAETQRVIQFNDAACRQLGYTREEFLGLRLSGYEASETPEEMRAHVQEALREGKVEFDTLHRTKTGEIRHLHVWARTFDLNGRVVFHAIFRDLTDHKQAMEAVKKSEARYRALTESATAAIITADSEGNIAGWNHAAEIIFGYTAAEIIGQPLTRLMPHRYREQHLLGMNRIQSGGEPHLIGKTVELDGLRKDQSEFPLELSPARWETSEGWFVTGIIRDITERRQAEDALRRSEQFLAQSQRMAHLGTWVVDFETGKRTWSDELYRIYGVSPEVFVPTEDAFLRLIHPDDQSAIRSWIHSAMSEKKPGPLQFRVVRPDGTIRAIEGDGEVVVNAEHKPTVLVGTSQDITERKQVEQALHRSLDLLRQTGQVAKIGGWELDLETQTLRWTEEVYRIHEVDPAIQPTVAEAIQFYAPEARPVIAAAVQAAIDAGTPWDLELPLVTAHGRRIWVRALGTAERRDGKSTRLYGTFQDITARRRAEEAEARLISILEATPDLVGISDPEGPLVYMNRAGRKMLGIDELADLTRYNLREFRDPANAHVVSTESIPTAVRDGAWSGETEFVALDGHAIPVSQVILAHKAPNGTVAFFSTIARDVTERKRADESRRLQSAALHAAADAIVITDRAGVIDWVNPAFGELTGYAAEDVGGKTPKDLIGSGKHAPAFFKEFWETILSGRTWRGEMINRRKDGSLYTEDQRVTPILDASGTITHFVAIKRDITERLQIEAQLRQAQKMESVGQLAGGIAHDFNNVLTAILGFTELALTRVDDPGVVADLKEVKDAGERAHRLTRQLLAFSRKQVTAPRVLDLNVVVADVAKMLQRVIGEDVQLRVELAPSLAPVRVDPGHVEQLLMNLAVNARDAMPKGGRLTIRTSNVTIDAEFVRRHPGAAVGECASLAVEDTGHGMPAELVEHIFEPFFTTKPMGKGTGLGLATVHGIVHQSGGHVSVASTVGVGTTITSYFPRVHEAPQPAPERARPQAELRGSETILVAEDQTAVREFVSRVLTGLGYAVLAARDGPEAVEIESGHPGRIDMLLSDVIMPGLNGPDLAQRLLRRRPDLKVLYVSGFTSHLAIRLGTIGGRAGFLQKPFLPDSLALKVREILDLHVGPVVPPR